MPEPPRIRCLDRKKNKAKLEGGGWISLSPQRQSISPLVFNRRIERIFNVFWQTFFKKIRGNGIVVRTAEHNTAPPIVRPLSLSKEEEGKVLLSPNAPFSSFQATAEWADSLLFFYRGFSLQRAFYWLAQKIWEIVETPPSFLPSSSFALLG